MKIYWLGFIMIFSVSCGNAGGGKSQRRDTTPAHATRDTQPVPEARDTSAVKFREPAAEQERDTTPPLAITLAKRPPGPPVDTVLDIDIDGASLEGSEVKATYIRDTLRRAEWEIFGETFQSLVIYTFPWNGKVNVRNKLSRYKVSMGDVKSDKDMYIDNFLYLIDTNGIFLSGKRNMSITGNIADMFGIFKQNVPMILKP